MTKPLFKPRKPRVIDESTKKSLLNHIRSSITEITKNSQYCVSKLPGLPKLPSIVNGYSANDSKYAVSVSESGVYVWSYSSTDTSPLVIEFPIDTNDKDASGQVILPLAVLTTPIMKYPGIVIVNGHDGVLNFYENVQHSPALGIISNKDFQLCLPIQAKQGEFITMIENVQPCGIILVTSWKRMILVQLYDHQNKVKLTYNELLKPINGMLKFFKGINDDIISIKRGKIIGNTQEIIVLEKSGLIHIFIVDLITLSFKVFKHSLNPYVENSIQTNLKSITYFDICKLSTVVQDTYLILCQIDEHLVIITAKIDNSGILVYGSHTSIKNPYNKVGKLLVPLPETTAFIILDQQIVLLEMDYSYFSNRGTISYYKPTWEDSITIKAGDIIGFGYEDHDIINELNPSVILLTNSGVLRVERFLNTNPGDGTSSNTKRLKSHIEQMIFYDNEDVEFAGDDGDKNQSIREIITEIMNSTSPYLPNYLNAVKNLMEKKIQVFQNLIKYADTHNIEDQVKLEILYGLEKIQFSLMFYNFLNNDDAFSKSCKKTLNLVISEQYPDLGTDLIRKFFNEKLDDVNKVFCQFVNLSIEKDLNSSKLLNLITNLFYCIFEIDATTNIMIKKSWIFETDVFFKFEKYFQSRFINNDELIYSVDIRDNFSNIIKIFYYFINQAIDYMKLENNPELVNYKQWYKVSKTKWIKILITNKLVDVAIELVETYKDFNSLCSILEDERNRMIELNGSKTNEYNELMIKYYVYFEKYNYDFAESLFNYYFKNNNIQMLLVGFPRYKRFLDKYLLQNQDKLSSVAWIYYLNNQDFTNSTTSLLTSANIENDEQRNQELKYSLAKLSIIANETNGRINDDELFQVETKLILIRIQKSLYQYVVNESSKGLKLQVFIKNYLNAKIDSSTLNAMFKPSFDSFIKNQQLSDLLLIDYLTFIKPTLKFSHGFANAFKIASLITDESIYKLLVKKIWCRLISITDDWSELIKTDEKTDDYVNRKIQNSVMFKTIKSFNDDKFITLLEELLSDSEDSFIDDNIILSELNKSYFNQAINNIKQYDILSWIESMKHQDDYL